MVNNGFVGLKASKRGAQEEKLSGKEKESENNEEDAERRRKETLLEDVQALLVTDPDADDDRLKIKPQSIMRSKCTGRYSCVIKFILASQVRELMESIPVVSKKLRENIVRAAKDLEDTVERNKNQVRENGFLSSREYYNITFFF